ncbi:ketoacyl-ACP synthase III [Streptomyces pathocidini]|uniref:ketoacyl-ACP synthase III n=1 Tax=Streptomyces pathocidini TaxID=1650571 RepID=UPI00340214B8
MATLGLPPFPVHESRLLGLGSYRPSQVGSSKEVAARVGVDAQWIELRTGILSRRFAAEDEDVEAMAFAAAANALAAAAVDPVDIDCVILASQSHLSQTPPLAPRLAHRLGTRGAGAFDLKSACSGFCIGLAAARDYIRCGGARHILVIASEKLSHITDHTDRDTAGIFADGAGAAVVGPARVWGIGPMAWASDGSCAENLGITSTWADIRDDRNRPAPAITMDGTRLMRWVLQNVREAVAQALQSAGVQLEDLNVVVPHQANGRFVDLLADRLQLPAHITVAHDVVHAGNTSAASIPLAIEQLMSQQAAHEGDLALLLAFGAGVTYAAQVVRLPAACRSTDRAQKDQA